MALQSMGPWSEPPSYRILRQLTDGEQSTLDGILEVKRQRACSWCKEQYCLVHRCEIALEPDKYGLVIGYTLECQWCGTEYYSLSGLARFEQID